MPDVDRRFWRRVPPDRYIRVDTNDYSLDPRLVGRRAASDIPSSRTDATLLLPAGG